MTTIERGSFVKPLKGYSPLIIDVDSKQELIAVKFKCETSDLGLVLDMNKDYLTLFIRGTVGAALYAMFEAV